MDINSEQKDKRDVLDSKTPLGQKLSHEAVFMSMSKKAEKISTALYMVTDLIQANDPIRHRIRECGIHLITETRSMSHAFSGDIYFTIARTINKSWELVSLVEVASSVGFVSDMNARILRSVLIEFISSLRDKQKRESFAEINDLKIGESLADQISLSKSLFNVQDIESNKGHNIKDKDLSFKKEYKHVMSFKTKEINNDSNTYQKSERKDKILEIIKEKREATIVDITGSFPDLSSKTIQRELLSLVESGVLKKEGEKRWSRYSLVTPTL